MTQSTLVSYLKNGYPHFKAASQLPVWLLPEHSFGGIVDKLGEEKLLVLSRPLSLHEGIKKQVEELPAPETLPDESWHQAIQSWPSLGQVWTILGTLLEVTSQLTEKFQKKELQANPETVCQALAVLGLAQLVPEGNHLVRDLALILKCEPDHPSELIRRYAQAVNENNLTMIKKIDNTIAAYPFWMEWARLFTDTAQEFPYIPRLIGITPPLSSELISVLAEMLQEEQDVEFGRDYQRYPAS